MSLLGIYFLYQGKRKQEIKLMLVGGTLLVLSYFLFF